MFSIPNVELNSLLYTQHVGIHDSPFIPRFCFCQTAQMHTLVYLPLQCESYNLRNSSTSLASNNFLITSTQSFEFCWFAVLSFVCGFPGLCYSPCSSTCDTTLEYPASSKAFFSTWYASSAVATVALHSSTTSRAASWGLLTLLSIALVL